jgi:hypothetical protein
LLYNYFKFQTFRHNYEPGVFGIWLVVQLWETALQQGHICEGTFVRRLVKPTEMHDRFSYARLYSMCKCQTLVAS